MSFGRSRFEVSSLPTRQNPSPRIVARGRAATLDDARSELADALIREIGLDAGTANSVANQAESVWTDFPEYGITVVVHDS